MWIFIAILPWLIIFWLAVPGSFTASIVILLISVFLLIVFYFVSNKITTKIDAQKSLDREKAIQEWERKWKRPHPTRNMNNNRSNLKQ